MDTLYRRNKVIPGSDWHFSELCPQWPVADFVQTSLVDPDQGDRICPICVRLSVENSEQNADQPARKHQK
jgi:hypothetical protein